MNARDRLNAFDPANPLDAKLDETLRCIALAEHERAPLAFAETYLERATAVALQYAGLILVDDVTDTITITVRGRLKIGLYPKGVVVEQPEKAPVGDAGLPPSELAARYVEKKARATSRLANFEGADPTLMSQIGVVLQLLADELRDDFHLPEERVFES